MSEELEKQTDQQAYHGLAEEYRSTKTTAMNSVLQCGKILFDAREKMGANMFKHFLGDPRVSESERTAARLIAVFKNFRHILNHPEKLDIFSQLGVSHLLELKKLPERFTKRIEVIIEKQGEEIKEICSVIDEEKLADFLDDTVIIKGESKKVRDLTATELRKVVNEQAGLFEPDDYFDNETPVEEPKRYGTPMPIIKSYEDDDEMDTQAFVPKINGAIIETVPEPKKVTTENIGKLLEESDRVLVFGRDVLGSIRQISDEELELATEKSKQTLKERIPQIISNSEALIVQLTEFLERL